MIIRRIVFGEPRPGDAKFARLLSNLDESVSYCNRTGPLEHDRVTDVPFTVPALGLNFVHPTPLSFVSARPKDDDPLGLFSWHHIELYDQAVISMQPHLPFNHEQCAGFCEAIYEKPGEPTEQWDARQDTAGVAWAVKFDGKRAYVIFRGSDDLLDWLRDLTGFDPAVNDPTFGPMWAGFLLGMPETWAAIKPLLVGIDEIIFTGHSLGAARADIAAAYAVTA